MVVWVNFQVDVYMCEFVCEYTKIFSQLIKIDD